MDAGADVNGGALTNAARAGHADVVRVLLEAGARINEYNGAAITEAARLGRAEVVQTLIEAGADVHVQDDLPLQLAARGGHIDVIQVLLNIPLIAFGLDAIENAIGIVTEMMTADSSDEDVMWDRSIERVEYDFDQIVDALTRYRDTI